MNAQESTMPPQLHSNLSRGRSRSSQGRRVSASSLSLKSFRARVGLGSLARRTLGIALLLVTVFLWTTSNFLASYIFADNTYSKPYFVTYINTSFFAFSLLPILIRISREHGIVHLKKSALEYWKNEMPWGQSRDRKSDEITDTSHTSLLVNDEDVAGDLEIRATKEPPLSLAETARLSLEFSLLWFVANYLVSGCFEYTSVASGTILTSMSSIWTLIFGAVVRVEVFSLRKLGGVLACLLGIILISYKDLSRENNDENRGNFPHKSQTEIAVGDLMAFGSAVMYGLYAVVMKKRIGNEDRVNMPLFFGLVGFFNVVFLWPGFVILHYTGIEEFSFPPTSKVWLIVLLNSASSFISDYCWAYAMLLTTPLVVTVGLSMTIPLSLIGQILLNSQHSNGLYWVGAVIVLLSFLFINRESHNDEEPQNMNAGVLSV